MEEKEDRISALPDCLLQHILSFLPSTEEAIRTGILSKRWKNQWTQVPVLIFDFYSGMFSDSDDSIDESDESVESFESIDEEFARFIDNVLLQHDCSKIKKLQLAYNFKKDSNFYEKIRFATRKHVEELTLNCYPDPREPYVLPKLLLFDNASLVELEIINCYFTHDRSINSGSLKALTMEGTTCDMLTANFLSGSSSLEFLEVKPHGGYWYVIASKTLKTLIISGIRIDKHRDIKVSCPNLEELSFVSCILPGRVITNVVSGCPLLRSLEIIDCHFEKLVIASKSLRKLVLGDLNECCAIEISCPNLENFDSYDYNYETFESMNGPSQYEGCQEVKANEIFEQLQNVEELTMGSWFIKILADVEIGGLSYLWSKTKILTLLLCMGLILSNFLGLYVHFVVHHRSRD